MGFDPLTTAGYFLVAQHDVIVATYFSAYYRTINEIVADLLDRIEREEIKPPWGEDYVVWYEGRVMAVIHQRMNVDRKDVTLYNDPRNVPPSSSYAPLPGWPTYEQWVERGKGELWFDPKNNPDPWP